jgi:peptidoglycan hydrolase-like protein with peptidoglycan-binding domain
MLGWKSILKSGDGLAAARQDVRELQVRLIDLSKQSNRPNWYLGNPDGQFGPKTETAVKAFQKDQNLIQPPGVPSWRSQY